MQGPHEGDYVVHALAFADQVRILTATTTSLVREGAVVQSTLPPASILFGRLLTGAALMTASAKGLSRLTLQVRGAGPLAWALARADVEGNVYGTLADLRLEEGNAPAQLSELIGSEGHLMVVRESAGGEQWTGTVPLATGGIGEDIAAYLLQSEQVRSAVGLGVQLGEDLQVRAAGGFLVQVLGGASEEALEELEERLGRVHEVGRDIEGGQTPEELLQRLCGSDHRILARTALRYHCPHDRAYYRDRLTSLGEEELRSLFEEKAELEIRCEFSGRSWTYVREDFEELTRSRRS